MSLPVYQELPCQLDDKGNGSVSFTPFVTYGTASVILSVTGATLTGQGYISLGNNPLGPCALAQGFGPFNVQYGQPVNIAITGGPPNALLQLALKGAIYIPGESTPGENLQFSAVTQQNSNVLVFKQNIALTGTVIYGPFEVSKFAGLNLLCEVNGQAQAVLSWTDVNGVTPLGASQWDLAKDLTGNGVYKVMDVAANLGPKVTLEIIPNGATEIASVSLVPSSTPLIGPSGTTLNAVAQISATVADGANATGQPSFVAAGPAVLSLVNEFDGKSWELQVFYVKADQSTHLIVSHVGTSKDYQVGISLPSAPCVVKYYNNAGDGTSQQVEVQLIKSSKGTGVGLPGPQGPQGPSGGGGTPQAAPESLHGIPLVDFDATNGPLQTLSAVNYQRDIYASIWYQSALRSAVGFPGGLPGYVYAGVAGTPSSGIYEAPRPAAEGFTLFCVMAFGSITASNFWILLGSSSTNAVGAYFATDASNNLNFFLDDVGTMTLFKSPVIAGLAANTPYLITARYSANGLQFCDLRLNSVTVSPLSTFGSTTITLTGNPTVGYYPTSGIFMKNGSIARIILLNRYLLDSELPDIENPLKTYYRI